MTRDETLSGTVTRGRHSRFSVAAAAGLLGTFLCSGGLAVWYVVQSYRQFAPASVSPLDWAEIEMVVGAAFTGFALVGASVVARRPRELIGWIMPVAALCIALAFLGDHYARVTLTGSGADRPLSGVVAAWLSSPLLFIGLSLGLLALPLFFPDGRLPSRAWRPVAAGAGLVVAGMVAVSALPRRLVGNAYPAGIEVRFYDFANPFAPGWTKPLDDRLGGYIFVAFIALFAIVTTATAVRFRRAEGVERQQLKWLTLAASVVATSMFAYFVGFILEKAPSWVPQSAHRALFFTFIAYPVGVGIAVLRYRLYEIDRLVSRTVTYGLVVVLAAVYGAAVVGLGAVLSSVTEGGGDLTVAAATLTVAALFRPLRSRIQRTVDRRFNRTGYEARRTVEAFARGLRDEVDYDVIRRELGRVADEAMRPAQVSVWTAGHDLRVGFASDQRHGVEA